MDHNPPTTADFAAHNAETALRKARQHQSDNQRIAAAIIDLALTPGVAAMLPPGVQQRILDDLRPILERRDR